VAVISPAFGAGAFGEIGYGTAPGGASTGPGGGAGTIVEVLFLEANDRNQIVACISDGTDYPPTFVYWNPAPAAWAEAFASPYPGDFPRFFALDAAGAAPPARWESVVQEAPIDEEWQIAGVEVHFAVRPTQMDGYDGGLGDLVPFFRVHIDGYGVAGVVTTSAADSRSTAVVRSASLTWSAADDQDISLSPWPPATATRLPCRIEQRVTSYRITVEDCLGVEFFSFRPYGTKSQRRG